MDEIEIILPNLFFIIFFKANFVILISEFKLTFITSSISFSLILIRRLSFVIPALFIRISILAPVDTSAFSKFEKLNWLILRLFATYGPGHKLNNYQGIINIILNQVLNNKKTILLKGSRNRTRGIIHAFDASEVIIRIALSKKKNQIFIVGIK